MSASILAELRAATGEAHGQLERAVEMEKRAAEVGRYAGLLEKFHGFYAPLEARLLALPGWSESGLDLGERRKTPSLARDLAALGRTQEEIAALPRCEALPRVDNLARGFGCAYVLEGATLGGRQITAMLRDGPVPAGARTFFASYGPNVGERWREFTAALERFAAAARPEMRSDIVAAAGETFSAMQRWIVETKGAR